MSPGNGLGSVVVFLFVSSITLIGLSCYGIVYGLAKERILTVGISLLVFCAVASFIMTLFWEGFDLRYDFEDPAKWTYNKFFFHASAVVASAALVLTAISLMSGSRLWIWSLPTFGLATLSFVAVIYFIKYQKKLQKEERLKNYKDPFSFSVKQDTAYYTIEDTTNLPNADTAFINTTKSAEVRQPEFPGGEEKFFEYIKEFMKYPEGSKKAGVAGRVFVKFVVDTDGSIRDVKISKSLDKFCDEEAVRLVSESPAWLPALRKGEKVRSSLVVPIKFGPS